MAPAGTIGTLQTVPRDVSLAGFDISGWRPDEVRELLRKWGDEIRREPVNARVDPATGGKVPHLNGLGVDAEATMAAVAAAAPGDRLRLAFHETPPGVTLDSLPPAPIYQGNEAKHAVTLLINVAWGEQFLPKILAVLAEQGVRATFFLVGNWVERFPDAAVAIAEADHEIASHGYSTAEFGQLSREEVVREIERSEEVIVATTGRRPPFFSPHKGEFTPHLLAAAEGKGYLTILWNVDTVDWMNPGVEVMLNRVLSQAGNGSLILMHPTAQTAESLTPMILGLKKKGLRIVTLGTLLSPSPLATDRVREP